MKIFFLKYKLTLPDNIEKNKVPIREELLKLVKENEMLPYYKQLVQEKYLKEDQKLVNELEATIEEKIKDLKSEIDDAETNAGESEVREAIEKVAMYYKKIGDKEMALTWFQKLNEKTVGVTLKIKIIFEIMMIGYTYGDIELLKRNIDKANTLIEEGGDWESKNRLKVYEGCFCMLVRNFDRAAELFLSSVATFQTTEIMDYEDFIFYTVILASVSLSRKKIKENVILNSEVLSVIDKMPTLKVFLNSLYDCKYHDFIVSLADITDKLVAERPFMAKHVNYYCREMRIRAYSQFLKSYKSVQLRSMADTYGVTEAFLDAELSRFISNGRISCKIDKVQGIIETTRPDEKTAFYNNCIKQGDQLLNRIQKLSRVMDL